jgi:Asp-tRNA(Asn)/Glu-tRNA(Gln) amidotransferase A subunit family amidase
VPFAVKDNIDVEGMPTTAACPAFSYVATSTAPAVRRLIDAGAVLVGKTNMDQFATGLVGTRSPFGACCNAYVPRYISGGSSSGSAIATATGLCAFALGTDTAGAVSARQVWCPRADRSIACRSLPPLPPTPSWSGAWDRGQTSTIPFRER